MKYLLILSAILYAGMVNAVDISPDKMQKLSVCWMVGEVASSVQQIRHDGDTLAMFRAKAPRALEGSDEFLIKKYISIGEDVYRNIDIEMRRSDVLVTYYTDCINNFESMAVGAQGGWF